MHVPTPSIFALSGFSDVVPNGLLEGQARLLHLVFLRDTRHDRLVHPRCYLSSIPPASSALVFCCWRLDTSLLVVFRHACLACPWPSSARFIRAFRDLSWWNLSSSPPPNLFTPLDWGAEFIRILFLMPPKVTIHCLFPLRRACLARLWRHLFFNVTFLLTLI